MKKLLLLSFLCLFLANCNDSDDTNPVAIDCAEIACTEEFVTLVVKVKDASGVNIVLDAFEVLDSNSLEDITIATNNNVGQDGRYPLYSDSFVSGNQNTKRTVVFRGYINDEKVVESEYVVDTNCCHVSIAVGDTDITIN